MEKLANDILTEISALNDDDARKKLGELLEEVYAEGFADGYEEASDEFGDCDD